MAYKIIVADSSPSLLETVRIVFKDSSYELYSFSDGEELLKQIDKINPDVIVIGLSLPKKDGYDVAGRLKAREKFKSTPLILLQGAFEDLNREKISNLSYEEIIKKPVDSEKLASMIKGFLEKSSEPQTLPEEPLLDGSLPAEWNPELERKVEEVVRREILDVERELEKRVRARIIADIKGKFIEHQKPEKSDEDSKHNP